MLGNYGTNIFNYLLFLNGLRKGWKIDYKKIEAAFFIFLLPQDALIMPHPPSTPLPLPYMCTYEKDRTEYPGGHPSKYWLYSTLLNFSDLRAQSLTTTLIRTYEYLS